MSKLIYFTLSGSITIAIVITFQETELTPWIDLVASGNNSKYILETIIFNGKNATLHMHDTLTFRKQISFNKILIQ